jgi:hypothetical protein
MSLPMSDQTLATIERRAALIDYGADPGGVDPADVLALVAEIRRQRTEYRTLQAELRLRMDEAAGRRRPVF